MVFHNTRDLKRANKRLKEVIFWLNLDIRDYKAALNPTSRQKRELCRIIGELESEIESREDTINYCFRQIQRLSGLQGASKEIQTENI